MAALEATEAARTAVRSMLLDSRASAGQEWLAVACWRAGSSHADGGGGGAVMVQLAGQPTACQQRVAGTWGVASAVVCHGSLCSNGTGRWEGGAPALTGPAGCSKLAKPAAVTPLQAAWPRPGVGVGQQAS